MDGHLRRPVRRAGEGGIQQQRRIFQRAGAGERAAWGEGQMLRVDGDAERAGGNCPLVDIPGEQRIHREILRRADHGPVL